MKELSIKDKARRYDEAIERARNHRDRDGLTLEQYETIDIIFPELKESESEDERIRKVLKEYFINSFQNNGVAAICGIHIKDILAWLEKQSKNNMGISEATKQNLDDNLNKALEKETPESWNEFLDEQKLAWSEEDERIRIETIELLETANHPNKMHSNGKPLDFTENINWLKDLKDKIVSQPQNTWKPSDEQIKALDEVYKTHGANNVCRHVLFNLMNDLKKLRKE